MTIQQLRNTPIAALPALAQQIRERIIEVIATRGGHLGASLGVVELTMALHYVFNTPDDVLVWDVGHQCYAHKIITGRDEAFAHILNAQKVNTMLLVRDTLLPLFQRFWVWQWHRLWKGIPPAST